MIPRIKGTDDILPPESAKWRRMLRVFDEMAERYGYDLAVMPVLESTELFARGVGEGTDVVEKQMYTFVDRGGRSVTLRPEFTAGMVRAYLDAGGTGVMKLAAAGPQFRYEQPQKGRRRQFFQLDLECIGDPAPEADVEIIEFCVRLFAALGVPAVSVLLNSIGDAADRTAYRDLLRQHLTAMADRLTPDARRRIETNPLRVLDSKVDAPKLGDAPRTIDHLCEPCKEHFARVEDGLDGLGIPYQRDPRLVRGLDYYTRTAFEYIATGLDAAQNAVGGGGRYDGLAEAIGGPPTPGVGFALGIDRLILAIGEPAGPYLDAYLVSETGPEEALRVASRLRQAGVSVDLDPDGRSVKAQFRAARRLDAPVILVWKGEGTVDVLAGDERLEMPIEEVPDWLARS